MIMNATKLMNTLCEDLSQRQREIFLARFGVEKSKEPQTLAALGDRYGITRERVRQIEAAAIDLVGKWVKTHEEWQEIIEKSKTFIKESGGVVRREKLLGYLSPFVEGLTASHMSAILASSGAFFEHDEDTHYWPFYYFDKQSLKAAESFASQWVSYLKKHKGEVLRRGYAMHLEVFLKKSKLTAGNVENFLDISKKFHTNSFGDTGLTEWPEIKPMTVRDQIYVVLKKHGTPMHFESIAKAINEARIGKKKALGPTVHNELIKDVRFVLVGRGTYGLAEYGFVPGTAKEVIHRILKKSGPMRPEEIMLAVQRERFFKPNTVLANLQNKTIFLHRPDGTYHIRES